MLCKLSGFRLELEVLQNVTPAAEPGSEDSTEEGMKRAESGEVAVSM